jgi:hypothetical protein
MAAAMRWRGGGVRCRCVVGAYSKGSSGGGDSSSSQYSSLLFFSNHCGWSLCLDFVELYIRNSNRGNILIFPLSQGKYPAGGGIYPKQREVSIDAETVVVGGVGVTFEMLLKHLRGDEYFIDSHVAPIIEVLLAQYFLGKRGQTVPLLIARN